MSAAARLATPAAAPRGDFADLDERVGQVGEGSVLLVQVGAEDAAHAVREHLARRLTASGFEVLRAETRGASPLWCELLAKLGLELGETDPARVAERVTAAARPRRAALLLPAVAKSEWDRAVTVELARLPGAPPMALVGDVGDLEDLRSELFEVATTLDDAARERWLRGIAEDAPAHVPARDLASLERWWASARRLGAQREENLVPAAIPSEGAALFGALALAQRAWPMAELLALGGSRRALEALLSVGAVSLDGNWVTLAADRAAEAERVAAAASAENLHHVASALARVAGDDPWALSRAAELLLRAGDSTAADQRHGEALEHTGDVLTRRELVERWARALAGAPEAERLPLSMRAAERALLAGEAEEAYRASQAASVLAPKDGAVALLLGRAAIAMGDLVAAGVALDHARTLATAAPPVKGAKSKTGAPLHAEVAVELSEVAYISGDLELAVREAEAGLAHPVTELHARNTLGKVLLAQSKWDEADRHFAEDAFKASAARDGEAELRARLNRGIALLSKGLLDEARSIFEEVRDDGERTGAPRACAFAFENLAVVAMWRHDYGTALNLLERAFKAHQRLGDRLKIAHNLGNLAQLRYKLGLVEHAEHAILFGRRTLGPGMPPHNAARFSIVAARLALLKSNTAVAQREVARAIVDGEHAGHRMRMAGEAYRLAARIALEDGDLGRAEEALAKARTLSSDEEARAEIAYLGALAARASGRPDATLANEALLLARALGEEELLRDAHVLLHEMHRAEGNLELARDHIEQAVALRDQVAQVLAGEVRAAFLARPDVAGLSRLLAQTQADLPEGEAVDAIEEARPSLARGAAASTFPREIVGEDPTVRALRAAIKKVARADSTILIRGESGTGKELVAEALHRASDRANGPLVTVNCAALVETLLLSELFGHEKGAFTGAAARRRGRFELAEGGTLFLDEIGDISARTQVALLRVLQERTFERVGGTTSIRANVRIVCATHRDLKAMVERGEFREDLYYRLRGITLEVPALRQRMGDLPRITDNLLARIAHERNEAKKTLAPAAIDLLARHRWPGNIRELENVLRAASLFAEGEAIQAADITENVEDLRGLSSAPPSRASLPPTPVTVTALPAVDLGSDDDEVEVASFDVDAELPADEAGASATAYACVRQGAVSLSDIKRQIERDCIARALAETRGNITRAAALLGMKRPRLSQLVKQYGLAAVSEGSS